MGSRAEESVHDVLGCGIDALGLASVGDGPEETATNVQVVSRACEPDEHFVFSLVSVEYSHEPRLVEEFTVLVSKSPKERNPILRDTRKGAPIPPISFARGRANLPLSHGLAARETRHSNGGAGSAAQDSTKCDRAPWRSRSRTPPEVLDLLFVFESVLKS